MHSLDSPTLYLIGYMLVWTVAVLQGVSLIGARGVSRYTARHQDQIGDSIRRLQAHKSLEVVTVVS